MATNITSDGFRTNIKKGKAVMNYGDGFYTATTDMAQVQHEQNGKRVSATTLNQEISGNVQRVCAGNGETSEYKIKIVGSPEMFAGQDQRAADYALNDLKALMLQPGDSRKEGGLGELASIDFQRAVSSMTTSMTNSFTPQIPQINRLQDLPMFTAYLGTWIGTVSAGNAAYQAVCAGELEVERQLAQKAETIKRLKKQYGQDFDVESLLSGGTPTPSTESNPNAQFNITRQTVYENYIPNLPKLLLAENNIC